MVRIMDPDAFIEVQTSFKASKKNFGAVSLTDMMLQDLPSKCKHKRFYHVLAFIILKTYRNPSKVC